MVCIHRAHLHQILLDQIPQSKLKANSKIVGFKSTKAHFENGITVDADIIIGADGINSSIRKYVINDAKPIFRGYNIWRGIAQLNQVPMGYGSETWGKGKRVGIVPIKDNKFGWWATNNESENETDEPNGTLEKLKELFRDWHDPIPMLFENSPEIIKNKIGDRKPTKGWHKDNYVLLGDAAHPTTPNLGQGACMAIEGAYLLAKCLSQKEKYQEAFIKYEELHYKRSTSVTKQSLQNGKIGQLDNPIAMNLRNAAIKALPSSIALKMLDQYFGYDVTATKIT